MCNQTGYMAWVHGPFPAGYFNDINFFRHKLKQELPAGERVECANEYGGEYSKIDLPNECYVDGDLQKKIKKCVQARHTNLNRQFKTFGCLKQVSRHSSDKHCTVFCAVASIMQISLENGHPLFDLGYESKTIDNKLFM